MKKRNPICFAYFADGKFIGWYGGTFGPVSTCPKIYSDSDEQLAVITKNFNNKIKSINETTAKDFLEKNDNIGGAISALKFSSEDLLRGKEVELRIVKCPYYDGPNPEFDEVEFKRLNEARRACMTAEGIMDIPAPSVERSKAVKLFKETHTEFEYAVNHWIYADYEKVKVWASEEPTEFLKTIKYTKDETLN